MRIQFMNNTTGIFVNYVIKMPLATDLTANTQLTDLDLYTVTYFAEEKSWS